jgi:hypothetical protein
VSHGHVRLHERERRLKFGAVGHRRLHQPPIRQYALPCLRILQHPEPVGGHPLELRRSGTLPQSLSTRNHGAQLLRGHATPELGRVQRVSEFPRNVVVVTRGLDQVPEFRKERASRA